MIYSFSRLDLFEKCPYRWYLKYILGRDEPVSKPLALGKAVHKALELRVNGVAKEEALTVALVETDFHPEVTREEIEQLMDRAPMLKGETEVRFELPLSTSSSAPRIQGYIDLVQHGKFVDWKSNWRTYLPNFNMQLRLYAWAMLQVKGWQRVEATLFFLRFRRLYSVNYTRADANEAWQWALRLVDQIESKLFALELYPEKLQEIFKAKPGSHCKHCPIASECLKNFTSVI